LNEDGTKMIFECLNGEDRVLFAKRVLRLEGALTETTKKDTIEGEDEFIISEDTEMVEDGEFVCELSEPVLPDVVYFRARADCGVDEGFGDGSVIVCKGDPRVEKAVWTSDPYSIF
jgi:hypothetical protein